MNLSKLILFFEVGIPVIGVISYLCYIHKDRLFKNFDLYNVLAFLWYKVSPIVLIISFSLTICFSTNSAFHYELKAFILYEDIRPIVGDTYFVRKENNDYLDCITQENPFRREFCQSPDTFKVINIKEGYVQVNEFMEYPLAEFQCKYISLEGISKKLNH